MAENPLYGDELLELGKALTSEIHAIVENGRAYYLGLSPHEPPSLLSGVFNPETGPIIPYLVKVIRMLTRPKVAESHPAPRQSARLRDFEREYAAALDALRRLATDLAPLLNAEGGQKAIGRSIKFSLYFFRVATERFFRHLTWRRSILRLLLKNHSNEGFGIYIADRLLNDIAKAFEAREQQLRGEHATPAHEFFSNQLEKIRRKIEIEHERTRREIIKAINARNIEGLDISGPRTPECRDQVFAVVVFLANPKHLQNIHHACEQTFRGTKDGYENVERLYIWCYRNKSRIWAWVETYRLNHGID